MERFRRIRNFMLNNAKDPQEQRLSFTQKTLEDLEKAQIPVSDDPCRTCANPCDLGHAEYPDRFDVDLSSEMLGSVKPYFRQVVISTGKTDWEREITDEAGSLAYFLSKAGMKHPPRNSSVRSQMSAEAVPAPAPVPASTVSGVFSSRGATRLAILNGSHHPIVHEDDTHETVLVFPDFKLVVGVERSESGAEALWSAVLDPHVGRAGTSAAASAGPSAGVVRMQSWPLPYACVILLCSHKRRDNRCHIAAPKLQVAFTHALEAEGLEVHTQLDDHLPAGPPLEDVPGTDAERNAAVLAQLRAVSISSPSTSEGSPSSEDHPKRALILKNSHVGGHKFAGNVLIYTPAGCGSGVWYGRVTPHEAPAVVRATLLNGRVLPALLRGGVNLARPEGKDLLSW